ncbi:hypothetical protein [Planctomicrobium sp. SH664]|uniref:hypothetical protein n=1 Tax=Planctomicrobium sp. SH664 TaxID=3448125 RepID=UPI003F5B763E
MSTTSMPVDDKSLVDALEQNEFDIVGLVDACADESCVQRCLREIYFQILRHHTEPYLPDKVLLAQVLVGMVSVARQDYAAEGHQEYWPFLFSRIREAVFADPEKFWGQVLAGPQSQSLLGRWFREALESFGYSVPSEGQAYVGPIVFHAGMPSASLPRAMAVIGMACDQFGPQAVTLPSDIRSQLVINHFLHRNVERLLSSNLQGATQLWGCLARVVLAWKTLGDCNDELQQLPLALDPDEVRAALPSESETPRVARAALPQLRYDPETGEIRLTFPSDTSTNWKVTSDRRPIELFWSRTHLGQTAEFNGPFPEKISVDPTTPAGGTGRVFTPYPSEWPGYWFHAHNGNLEDGLAIDASGIGSGRWYVVFEGTPSKCSVPFVAQIQLKWSWFKGNQNWTAWEVEVPPRSASQTHLEWFVGDNCFRVPLARRPGPRVEFVDSSIAQAATPDGNQLGVYAAAPTVILRRELPISLQLLKESTDSVAVIVRVDLKPETATRLPVEQAGIYQLRESRGVGRTLLRFAIVPGLKIQGPVTDSKNLSASVVISAADDAGQICDDREAELTKDGRHWIMRSTTVEPMLKVRWCWSTESISPLTFRWPLEALRWRITHAGDEYSGWTREPLFISPKTVAERDAQLEIQTPAGSDLEINREAYTGRVQTGPSGNTCVLSLLSYGETVELESEGQRYAAVFQSERPLIDSLQGDSDAESLIVTWQSTTKQGGMVVVAWNPCDVLSSPKAFSLSAPELEFREWLADCDDLPGTEWTSISLARSAGGFFQKVLHLAARRSETLEPASLLLSRSTGEVRLSVGRPATWPEFLHHISLMRLNRSAFECEGIATLLSDVVSSNEFELASAIRLLADLDRTLAEPSTNDRDRNWAQAIHRAVLTLVRRVSRDTPGLALSGDNAPEIFVSLLRLGIPVGRFYPIRWIATGQLPANTFAYPLTYIRDLWLLGTGRRLLEHQLKQCGESLPQQFDEMQSEAASRVLEYHEKLDLPSISAFLPLSRRTAMTASTDLGHHHSFALPPLPNSLETPDELCEVLGFDDKALDCQATCDDQFFDTHSRGSQANGGRGRGRSTSPPSGYSLYWSVDENRWAIETLNRSSPTCCFTNTQPLVVEPIPARELANTTILESLATWTHKEILTPELIAAFNFLDRYKDVLVADPTSGPLHAEIFKPGESEVKELFGRTVQVETRAGLPPLALIAWQLAWIDRISAWEGENAGFEQPDEISAIQREFLSALAVAIAQWPKLMQRTVALAELVYWTLYRGGLGAAARFRSDHTESQMSILETLPQAHIGTIPSPASIIRPTGDSASEVSGIIVGYDAGIGIVLLHHRSSPSLEATLHDYVTQGDAEQHWFASFRWPSISEGSRERLQRMQAQKANNGGHHEHCHMAEVICGMRVTCKLQKKPRWEAVEMAVDFGTRKAHLPKYRRRRPNLIEDT